MVLTGLKNGCLLALLACLWGCVHGNGDRLGSRLVKSVPQVDQADHLAAPETCDGLENDAEEFLSVSTVAAPEGSKRPISLAECICLALDKGRTGEFYDRTDSDRHTSVTGIQLNTQPSNASDAVRVFVYDPTIVGTDIEQALSRFDVLWRNSLLWTHVDAPRGIDAALVPRLGVLNEHIDNVQFRTELLKPLPTGGVAGLMFRTDAGRSLLPATSGVLNPAYAPGLALSFEQPLLQGAGVLLNQVRESFPFSPGQAIPSRVLPTAGARPGILLARIGHSQSKLEFERRLQELLFAVEEAYWNLYCAYWDLYSWDNGLRQVHQAWQISKRRFDAKPSGVTDDELAQIEETYHFFRNQRLEALGRGLAGRPGVLEAERRLRYVTGLPSEDGSRLMPSDLPLSSAVQPDWKLSVMTARERRPELQQIYKELQAAELQVFRAKDFLKPDLRFLSRLGTNGLAESLSGSYHQFYNWETGVQLEVPVGYRAGSAEVQRATLQLAQRYAFLRDQEKKVILSLQRSYRDLVQFREQLGIRHSQRQAVAVQLKVRFDRYMAGKRAPGDVDLLVRTQRNWVDALRDEYQVLCKYNVALADFERQKGTILNYRNVHMLENGLPCFRHAPRWPPRSEWVVVEEPAAARTGAPGRAGAADMVSVTPGELVMPAMRPEAAMRPAARPEE